MVNTRTTAISAGIQEIVQKIVERYSPQRVILFGSYAYGKPHEGSDLDFLVVTAHSPSRQEAWKAAHELGRRSSLPLQIIFISPAEFDETKDVVGGLAYPAHHWGRVLYEANP